MTNPQGGQSPASPSPHDRPRTWIELLSQVVKSRTQTRHMIALVRSIILALSVGVAIVAAVVLSVALAAKGLYPVFATKGLHPVWLSYAVPVGVSGLSLVTLITIGAKKLVMRFIQKRARAPSDARQTSTPPSQEYRELGQTPPKSHRLRRTRRRFGPYRLQSDWQVPPRPSLLHRT